MKASPQSQTELLRSRDLRDRGVSPHEFGRLVKGLTIVAPGTYADLTDLSAEAAHRMRAQAVLDRLDAVVASHATALTLWNLPTLVSQLTVVHVRERTDGQGGRSRGVGTGCTQGPSPVNASPNVRACLSLIPCGQCWTP